MVKNVRSVTLFWTFQKRSLIFIPILNQVRIAQSKFFRITCPQNFVIYKEHKLIFLQNKISFVQSSESLQK